MFPRSEITLDIVKCGEPPKTSPTKVFHISRDPKKMSTIKASSFKRQPYKPFNLVRQSWIQ